MWIHKASGKQRPLGISTVVDRLIRHALSQVLSLAFEPGVSESSYGFGPGRSTHQGYRWVEDLDLEEFFDRINNDNNE